MSALGAEMVTKSLPRQVDRWVLAFLGSIRQLGWRASKKKKSEVHTDCLTPEGRAAGTCVIEGALARAEKVKERKFAQERVGGEGSYITLTGSHHPGKSAWKQ